MAEANTSILEKLAEEVARDVQPQAEVEGERGFDFMTIITLVMTIAQTLIQSCPQPANAVKAAFKKPNLRQRAALLKIAKENCDCCNMGRQAGRIQQAMLAKAALLPDADVAALIQEASDDRNLLF